MNRSTKAFLATIAAVASTVIAVSPANAATNAAPGFELVEKTVQPHSAVMTIALVAPPGTTPNFSREEAVRSADQAAQFLNADTDGELTVEIAQVSDWIFPTEEAPCSWTGVWLDAAANALGWQPGPGKHLTVMVPGGEPCPGWANGDQGASLTSGGRTFQPGTDSSTLVHEWGHNMSQAHAFSTACPTWDFVATNGRTPAGCERKEYGNALDVMGDSWVLTPFPSPALERIGMLPRRLTPACDAESTTTVDSVAAGAANRDAITWESSSEPGVRYWVDYHDGNQRGKYSYLYPGQSPVPPGVSGLQLLRTDPEVPIGTTVLERPGDPTPDAQLVRAGEAVTLTDGTVVSWSTVGSGSDRAEVTIARAC
ncbi:hypothetical protein [Microbacterium sp. lyk4-40-TSB-66]|uniref:hypothetical protein n=1 Tax=Microbacterium sp. lyk4-40-TSB-66 TaxID=3040294 RepID=UPI00254EE093|nr:hypothetical protein [Microbacterium sp. lyk4-40-TSB-66]